VMLRKWEDLPQEMRTEEVRPYYDLLRRKQGSLLCKRLFDILASLVLLVLLSPVFLVLAIAIWGGMYWVSKQFCKKHDIN